MEFFIFITEGNELEFVKELLKRKHGVKAQDKNERLLITGDMACIMAHPDGKTPRGGKIMLIKKSTYTIANIFANNVKKSLGKEGGKSIFIVWRDTDGIDLTNDKQVDEKKNEIISAHASAVKGADLKVFFCHKMLETWYIAGLDESHFGKGGIIHRGGKSTLLGFTDAECCGSPKQLFEKYVLISGDKKIASVMGQTLNIANACKKSTSFKEFYNNI